MSDKTVHARSEPNTHNWMISHYKWKRIIYTIELKYHRLPSCDHVPVKLCSLWIHKCQGNIPVELASLEFRCRSASWVMS